ncbi:MAG TPA: glycosyltransferase family 2 protein [Methyloceanibacter sp.]|nr:glycosyltransferase family 2 protein [Methyloceanibacter sp.]
MPDLHPRTKPKALNYALPLARGEYLVIYDAEDRPERDQLRKAIAVFQEGPPNLACLQAKLNLYNASDNWLTRQFTIEYDVLFEGLLPALDRLQLPIPLGGTSNHFRVSALRWLMAWDAFNVTEDADLGTRLGRSRYRCQMLDSTTFEEAPAKLSSWFKQRTRCLRGYMQTWFVHMRQPARLWRELGPAGFLGFQVMIGGTVLSALVHPWFYALAAFDIANGAFLTPPAGWLGLPFWLFASLGLGVGYLASMLLGVLALKSRSARDLLSQVPLMPFYWLLIQARPIAPSGSSRPTASPGRRPRTDLATARRVPRRLCLTRRYTANASSSYPRAGREYCESTRSMTCLASTSASSFCITKVCRVDRANSGKSDRVG